MDNLYKILKENREFLEEDKDIFKRPFFISNIDLKSDYEDVNIIFIDFMDLEFEEIKEYHTLFYTLR